MRAVPNLPGMGLPVYPGEAQSLAGSSHGKHGLGTNVAVDFRTQQLGLLFNYTFHN